VKVSHCGGVKGNHAGATQRFSPIKEIFKESFGSGFGAFQKCELKKLITARGTSNKVAPEKT
jgi:hypothetical protein